MAKRIPQGRLLILVMSFFGFLDYVRLQEFASKPGSSIYSLNYPKKGSLRKQEV